MADLVLDLAGYTPDVDLAAGVAIEPACGPGTFVSAMAQRLAESCQLFGQNIAEATGAIVAVDIAPNAVDRSRALVVRSLTSRGVQYSVARELAQGWVRLGDFLRLAPTLPNANWIVGNPPYVRIENIDAVALRDYRASWETMTGRADIYVGFIEASLDRLNSDGSLAFICADRWMRNQYGAKLRHLVETSYSMDACVVLHEVDAFEDRVDAYPAVVVIGGHEQGAALVAEAAAGFQAEDATLLTQFWNLGAGGPATAERFAASWVEGWFSGKPSWPAGTPQDLALVAELEGRLPPLEAAGVTVGVGGATGADAVFITDRPGDVERDRLIATVGGRELSGGAITWRGRYLVNPWRRGVLVNLNEAPGLRAHLTGHRAHLEARYVAKQHPDQWWRTIDKIDASIATADKLLVPDLRDRVLPVLDRGNFYPMHSLSFVRSDVWDLEVLGGLLMSDIANLFVSTYSVKMASGYMRVSAQYLRRIHVPYFADIAPPDRERLRDAFMRRDVPLANEVAARIYSARADFDS